MCVLCSENGPGRCVVPPSFLLLPPPPFFLQPTVVLIALMRIGRVTIRVTRASGGRESCLSCLRQVVSQGRGGGGSGNTADNRSAPVFQVPAPPGEFAGGSPHLLSCPLLEPFFTTSCDTDPRPFSLSSQQPVGRNVRPALAQEPFFFPLGVCQGSSAGVIAPGQGTLGSVWGRLRVLLTWSGWAPGVLFSAQADPHPRQ